MSDPIFAEPRLAEIYDALDDDRSGAVEGADPTPAARPRGGLSVVPSR